MRGYCPKCKEYRSDNGKDAWSIIWKNGIAICERCGSVIDIWMNKRKKVRTFKNQGNSGE
ncbi:MAG: hypothetical protein J7K59_02975 [Candidatus Korarchaeota archaeon]|nr:hypothetical protein [Candidatus Korarchaeota archaeon]